VELESLLTFRCLGGGGGSVHSCHSQSAAGTCIQPDRFWHPLQAFPLQKEDGGIVEGERGGTNNKKRG
jgi:hypothetical protein